MPTESEPWQAVDLSEVEDKLSKLSTAPKESASTTPMETTSTSHVEATSTASVEAKAEVPPSPPAQQEEADFGSEPEEVALKTPLVSTQVTLPTSTSAGQDSTKDDATLLTCRLYWHSISSVYRGESEAQGCTRSEGTTSCQVYSKSTSTWSSGKDGGFTQVETILEDCTG